MILLVRREGLVLLRQYLSQLIFCLLLLIFLLIFNLLEAALEYKIEGLANASDLRESHIKISLTDWEHFLDIGLGLLDLKLFERNLHAPLLRSIKGRIVILHNLIILSNLTRLKTLKSIA